MFRRILSHYFKEKLVMSAEVTRYKPKLDDFQIHRSSCLVR